MSALRKNHCPDYPGITVRFTQESLSGLGKNMQSDSKKFDKAWDELIYWGVLRQDTDDVFFSKRMVEDEKLRHLRREVGSRGGNPHLVNHPVNHVIDSKFKSMDNQNVTSSSSTTASSSSSKNKNKTIPPVFEEIGKYILEIGGNQKIASTFYNYYESNGWKVGKNPMKDWKACARNWVTRNLPNQFSPTSAAKKNTYIDKESDFE